ncbi:MAG: DUF1566 domain-containing protein [Giesbergeria sp.]|nr:DUF1566 domain-containing protein [Giesbergeria sp.]
MKRFFPRPRLAGLLCALALPAWAAFTDNGDGTITDTSTGLVWDKCSRGQVWDNATPPGTCTGTASTHDWAAALAQATAANAASHRGQADWRLPNRTELESLVQINANNPAIDGTHFPATPYTWYWTSTTYAPGPANAWVVYFGNGYTNAGSKTGANHVRLVRSGQWFGAFDVLDVAAPVLSALGVTGTTSTATTLQATSNEVATGYWIAVPQGSAAPTAAQVKAGVSYGAVTVVAAGNGAMAAATPASFAVSGLSPSTPYTLYLVAEDGANNLSATPSSIDVTTLSAAVNGACGSASGVASATAPASNLCVAGASTVVTGSGGAWGWGCNGASGGSNAACAAAYASQSLSIGASPTSIFVGYTSTITASSNAGLPVALAGSAHCSVSGTTVTGTAVGTCTVTASQAGTGDTGASRYQAAANASVNIGVAAVPPPPPSGPDPVDGACGASHGQTLLATPQTSLCRSGTASAVSGTGPWAWTCSGQYGGTSASCSAAAAGSYAVQVITMFAGYMGRPAGVSGQAYYENHMIQSAGNFRILVDDFFKSDEGQALYGGKNVSAQIKQVYQLLFSRQPLAAGLEYWTRQVTQGVISVPELAYTAAYNAASADTAVLNAKRRAALAFTQALGSNPLYSSAYNSNLALGRAYLACVKSDASAAAVIAQLPTIMKSLLAGAASYSCP